VVVVVVRVFTYRYRNRSWKRECRVNNTTSCERYLKVKVGKEIFWTSQVSMNVTNNSATRKFSFLNASEQETPWTLAPSARTDWGQTGSLDYLGLYCLTVMTIIARHQSVSLWSSSTTSRPDLPPACPNLRAEKDNGSAFITTSTNTTCFRKNYRLKTRTSGDILLLYFAAAQRPNFNWFSPPIKWNSDFPHTMIFRIDSV